MNKFLRIMGYVCKLCIVFYWPFCLAETFSNKADEYLEGSLENKGSNFVAVMFILLWVVYILFLSCLPFIFIGVFS